MVNSPDFPGYFCLKQINAFEMQINIFKKLFNPVFA